MAEIKYKYTHGGMFFTTLSIAQQEGPRTNRKNRCTLKTKIEKNNVHIAQPTRGETKLFEAVYFTPLSFQIFLILYGFSCKATTRKLRNGLFWPHPNSARMMENECNKKV